MYSLGSLASSSQGTETLEDSVNFTGNTIDVQDKLIRQPWVAELVQGNFGDIVFLIGGGLSTFI